MIARSAASSISGVRNVHGIFLSSSKSGNLFEFQGNTHCALVAIDALVACCWVNGVARPGVALREEQALGRLTEGAPRHDKAANVSLAGSGAIIKGIGRIIQLGTHSCRVRASC